MGDNEIPQDVGLALAAKIAMKEKELFQKERRISRLKKETEATRRKALQSKRELEESTKKKAHEKNTMRAYFGASRNSEDRLTILYQSRQHWIEVLLQPRLQKRSR